MSTLTLPALLSPCCGKPVEGGPVIYTCEGCRHGSVIDREFTGPRPADCSHLHGAFGPGCPWCTPRDRAAARTPIAADRCATTKNASTS